MTDSRPRVLLLRLSALGDVVFALPALQALRHHIPQAEIHWLVEDRHAALPCSHPGVDEVIVFPRRAWREARGLRRLPALGRVAEHLTALRSRGRYDVVLDLQGNLKSALHILFLRAERSIGFDKPVAREGAQRFVRERIADPGRVHRTARDLELVRALGYRGTAPPGQAWAVDREAQRAVDLRLGHFLSTPERGREGGPVVLLHTEVTRYGRDKEWPEERWLGLAHRLCRSTGARVLVLWTEASRGRALSFVDRSEGACALAPPTPSLEHLMALSDRAALLIGTDSGPVHLAAHRGTAVLALFGPTDPVRYAPSGPRAEVVSALGEGEEPPPRDRSRRSPLMEDLELDAVAARAETLLGQAGTQAPPGPPGPGGA